MSKSILLNSTSEKVLAYDVQILFGKNMKTIDIIEELLPRRVPAVEVQISNDTEELSSMDEWLKGLMVDG